MIGSAGKELIHPQIVSSTSAVNMKISLVDVPDESLELNSSKFFIRKKKSLHGKSIQIWLALTAGFLYVFNMEYNSFRGKHMT